MEPQGLGRDEWLRRMALVDQGLRRQGTRARLTIVGSGAVILAGQPGRTSIDLDVWSARRREARNKAAENLVYLTAMSAKGGGI